MFASRLLKSTVSSALPSLGQTTARRTIVTDVSKFLYHKVWRKSNIIYVTYVIAGAMVFEVLFGSTVEGLWKMSNRGKLYDDIDWSKWTPSVEDDDDDDDDDEEDDE